jgi:hypothetical protein
MVETLQIAGKATKSRKGYWLGKKFSKEHREYISRSLMGEKNPNYGKHQSAETKLKISLANTGRIPWNKGLTAKTCPKLQEIGRRISQSKKGLKLSEETKKKVGLASKRRWADPEYRARMLKRMLENRDKLMNAVKAMREKYRIACQEHKRAVEEEAERLKQQGFNVLILDQIRPDIIARKDEKLYAVEVEFDHPNYTKYDGIKFFDDIIWVMKEHDYSK